MTKCSFEMRGLTDQETDSIAGGMDANYKYCANGPAGEGVYPNYVGCLPSTWGEIYESWAALGRSHGGKA